MLLKDTLILKEAEKVWTNYIVLAMSRNNTSKDYKMQNSNSFEKTRKFLKHSDLYINYNNFNSNGNSVLNRVSSRGDSEESNENYSNIKLNARPDKIYHRGNKKKRKLHRTKPFVHRDDRSNLGS